MEKTLERFPDFYLKRKQKRLKIEIQEQEIISTKLLKEYKRSIKQILGTKSFNLYRARVWEYTNNQQLFRLKNIDKRDGIDWQLDHKISIAIGFKLCIPVYLIGSIDNLQVIPRKENFLKGIRCYSIIEYCK
jgi:hypothetical protein